MLSSQTSLPNYLLLLGDTPVDYIIDVRNKDIFYSDYYIGLLENAGIDISLLCENSDFIIVRNGGAQSIIIDNFRENESNIKTEAGDVQIYYDVDGAYHDGATGYYSVYVDGEEWLVGNIEDDTSMQISVKRCGDSIDNVKFLYTVNFESVEVNVSDVNR